MKIGPPDSGQNSTALRPLSASAHQVPAGSLIVSDIFVESDPLNESAHGGSVAAAARNFGFLGPLFYQQSVSQPVPELNAALQSCDLLSTSGLSLQQLSKALATAAIGPPLHMLLTGAEEVARVAESGATHSVLSLSSGTCKAQVSKMLYDLAATAWNGRSIEARQRALAVVENLAGLFPLNRQRLLDLDPTVSGPERRVLQNFLIRGVDQAWNSEPRIERARRRFSEAVKGLEAAQNSVVVAAGNEGLIKAQLELDGLGPLEVPADFERNVLDVEAVTMVGATIILDGIEGPARYSSGDQEIDIYVSGDKTLGKEFDVQAGLKNSGTSLAAPRIGAVMAALHGQHPHLDSDGVESVLEQEFRLGSASILDYGAANELFYTSAESVGPRQGHPRI